MEGLNPFLARHKEKADMNQYWYSKPTIQFMCSEVEAMCGNSGDAGDPNAKKCAFLSTPSIYFSLKDKTVKANSKVFDVSAPSSNNIRKIFLTTCVVVTYRSTLNSARTPTLFITTLTRTTRFPKSFTKRSI